MSAIAALYNVPSDEHEMLSWATAHAQHHRDIVFSINRQFTIQLQEYSLDPIPLNSLGAWVYQHQQMHNQFEAILGIAGFDLTDVKLDDPDILAGWVFLNASVHRQAADILGIG